MLLNKAETIRLHDLLVFNFHHFVLIHPGQCALKQRASIITIQIIDYKNKEISYKTGLLKHISIPLSARYNVKIVGNSPQNRNETSNTSNCPFHEANYCGSSPDCRQFCRDAQFSYAYSGDLRE